LSDGIEIAVRADAEDIFMQWSSCLNMFKQARLK